MEGSDTAANLEPDPVLDSHIEESTPQEIREALSAVFLSTPFRTSKQSQHLLQYLVDQTLEGRDEMLKERIVGANVFDRNPGYDTGDDPIVRVRAADLRKRLIQYYSSEGAERSVRIEIHPGSYRPVFISNSQRQAMAHAAEAGAVRRSRPVDAATPSIATDSVSELPDAIQRVAKASDRIRWVRVTLAVAGLMMILLAAACIAMWNHIQSMNRSFYPWRYEPSVAAFWSGFFDSPKDTDIVMSDSAFSMIQTIGGKQLTLSDYRGRNYWSQFGDLAPGKIADLNTIARWTIGSTGEFKLVQHFLAMDPLNKKIHVYNAREYMSDLIKRDNVIFVGSRIANPWDELFEDRMNFIFEFDPINEIVNRSPAAGEQKAYIWAGSVGYSEVAFLPKPDHNGNVILIEGSTSETTQAAGDFLLSEDQLSNFKKILHVTKLPYFEVLLKTSWVRDTPISTAIEAYRTYPNLQ